MKTNLPEIVSAEALAEFLNVGRRQVEKLAARGVILRQAPGRYRLHESVQGYLRSIEAEAERRQVNTPSADKLRDIRAADTAARIEARQRELLPRAMAEDLADRLARELVTSMAGLGAKISEGQSRDERRRRAAICAEEAARLRKRFEVIRDELLPKAPPK